MENKKTNQKKEKSLFTPVKASMNKRAGAYFIDIILYLVLVTGVLYIMSFIVGYHENFDLLEQKYIEHGVYVLKNGVYELCLESDPECLAASNRFYEDPKAVYYLTRATELSVLMITLSTFVTSLIYEFIVPLFLKNGQTIGMKIMRVGLIDNEGVKVTPIQIFIRFLFGKYIICMLIPIYGFIYMGFNVGGGLLGLIVLVSVPIINLIMTYGTQTKSGIANSIAKVYAIDLDDTYIFKNKEERSRALAEQDRLKEEMKKTY